MLAALLAVALCGQGSLVSADAASSTAPKVSFTSWPKDVISVSDTTAGLKNADGTQVWPVKAAAARWSKDNPVDRYTTGSCPADVQCVVIEQAELADPTVGLTATSSVGADIKSSSVALDTSFGRTNSAARHQNVVCHEMGRALGLKHGRRRAPA